jgi:hypothetical protein
MTAIRWVCLSDTHFGAENSLLSHLPPGTFKVDPTTPSPVLVQLVRCLDALVKTSTDTHPPHLILNGDILEMALATDDVAGTVFERFIELSFVPGAELFDDTIYFLPGNHDHHMWETAREQQYAEYVRALPADTTINPPWHVTTMFETPDTPFPEAQLMTTLARRQGSPKLSVASVYPNFGVVDDEITRGVLLHHGHFVEPFYTLMSQVKADLFPGQPRGNEVWDWESDNFAWIDFFWSTLGRSGEVGDDVGLIYDMLQDDRALDTLAQNLARSATGALPGLIRPEVRGVALEVTKHLATHIKNRERANPSLELTPSTDAGLVRYLSGPLRSQVEHERKSMLKAQSTFVFGHTHKPFQNRRHIEGYAREVDIYNTGGWVVDTEATSPLQGAAVVLIDDKCNVASLRLYNQADRVDSYAVTLAEPLSGEPNALHSYLARNLDFSIPPWITLSTECAQAVTRRHEVLPLIIETGLALTTPPPSERA